MKKERQEEGKGEAEQNGEVGERARLRGREMRGQKRKGNGEKIALILRLLIGSRFFITFSLNTGQRLLLCDS